MGGVTSRTVLPNLKSVSLPHHHSVATDTPSNVHSKQDSLKETQEWRPVDIPPNEKERLAAVKSYQTLDEQCEDVFDTLTTLVTSICKTKYSAIGVLDTDRTFFFSEHGLNKKQAGRVASFCAYAILTPDEPLFIPDARKDGRTFIRKNPQVIEGSVTCYYAIPLVTPEGHALGTLCAIDNEPHYLNEAQKKALTVMARMVMVQLQLRKYKKRASKAKIEAQERAKLAHEMVHLLHLFPTSNPYLSKSLADQEQATQEFVDTLTDGEGLLLLIETLTREFSVENIFFWQAVEDFRADPSLDVARSIYDVYVARGSPLMTNLKYETSVEIRETIAKLELQGQTGISLPENRNLLASLFDVAQIEAYQLVFRDSFRRLHVTDEFEEYRSEYIRRLSSSTRLCDETRNLGLRHISSNTIAPRSAPPRRNCDGKNPKSATSMKAWLEHATSKICAENLVVVRPSVISRGKEGS